MKKKNKNRKTTKKKYDCYVSPQNEPHMKQKRLLHFLSCFWLVINCIVFANLLPTPKTSPLIALAFVFIVYAFIQQIDQRRSAWAWWAIIFWSIASVAISAGCILAYELYWYFIVIAAQIIISTIIFCICKKK